MPKTSYWAGSSIPITLAVTDADGAVNPTSASIVIRGPNGVLLENGTAMSVSTNEVAFTLAASKTTDPGIYTFTSSIILPSGNTVVHRLSKTVE